MLTGTTSFRPYWIERSAAQKQDTRQHRLKRAWPGNVDLGARVANFAAFESLGDFAFCGQIEKWMQPASRRRRAALLAAVMLAAVMVASKCGFAARSPPPWTHR
jgi:hypothetical protein